MTHIIIWEFIVTKDREAGFRLAYSPAGPWANLFKRAKGYLGTELLHDPADPQRYLTIDRWASAAAYDAFRQQWAAEYESLDNRCEGLAERETLLETLEIIP